MEACRRRSRAWWSWGRWRHPFELVDVVSGQGLGAGRRQRGWAGRHCRMPAEGRGLLVMFICVHCPYVKHVEQELARIGVDYAGKIGMRRSRRTMWPLSGGLAGGDEEAGAAAGLPVSLSLRRDAGGGAEYRRPARRTSSSSTRRCGWSTAGSSTTAGRGGRLRQRRSGDRRDLRAAHGRSARGQAPDTNQRTSLGLQHQVARVGTPLPRPVCAMKTGRLLWSVLWLGSRLALSSVAPLRG
jgi:hypothetical protein